MRQAKGNGWHVAASGISEEAEKGEINPKLHCVPRKEGQQRQETQAA